MRRCRTVAGSIKVVATVFVLVAAPVALASCTCLVFVAAAGAAVRISYDGAGEEDKQQCYS